MSQPTRPIEQQQSQQRTQTDPYATPDQTPDQMAGAIPDRTTDAELSVIGLGASAGGLAALQTFFDTLPSDTGMSFVVVIHLSPNYESLLAQLLQSHTAMPVTEVAGPTAMQPNHVYVIPPGKRLVVAADHLDLAELNMPRGQRLQIDIFFRSLAEHHGDGAAIILSGGGSDGAVGIQRIKQGGGLVLVQDPAEAEFGGMPRSAIATGLVDIIAPVAELATQLIEAKRTRARLELPSDPDQISPAAAETLTQLLKHLQAQTGHDFGGYQWGPLLQRIGRRMQLAGQQTLSGYLQQLRQDTGAVETLYHDLVTNVTEFFHDSGAWERLAKTVIPQLFVGKGVNDSVRVWTVGCANGEEAYSIGMLLLEYAATLDQPPKIQIFASDLRQPALAFAREGVYPQAIAANVSEERLAHFFEHHNSHYRVRQPLRDLVIFTPHNLLQDPPFARLDLIICRNQLMYLQDPWQERVYATFHYALRQEAGRQSYLFLGSADRQEDGPILRNALNGGVAAPGSPDTRATDTGTGGSTMGEEDASSGAHVLFTPVDATQHIYQCRQQSLASFLHPSGQSHSFLNSSPPANGANRDAALSPTARAEGTHQTMHHRLLEEMAPPSVLVDETFHVLYLSETVGRYLRVPGGPLTRDITRLVRLELQMGLQTALAQAFATQRGVHTQPVPVQFDDILQPVSLFVHPSPQQGRAVVLFFEGAATELMRLPLAEDAATDGGAGLPAKAMLQMERQLAVLRAEYESTMAALHATHEELQSDDEEHQVIVEEMESNKEELQAVNEELLTVNEELKEKVQVGSTAHSDLQNLFAITEIAALFLDRDLRVVRYTEHAVDLFNLIPADQGRSISHLHLNLYYDTLEADAHQVLATLTPIERDVQGENGRWFLLCIRPYRTEERRVEGVIITLVDVTHNKQIELALRDAKAYAESIVETIPDALLVLDPKLSVQRANDAFYAMFQVTPETTEGRLIYELGNGQWDIPALHTLLEEVLPENHLFTGYEMTHHFEAIGTRTLLLNGRRLAQVKLILLSITDITARKRAEEALRAGEERYRLLVESAQEYAMFMLSPDGRITSWNRGAERIFGYSEAEALGLDARVIFTEEDQAAGVPEHELATALEKGQASDDRWHRRKDGSHFWANGVMEALRHPDGSLRGFAKVLRDNTEQKQAADALRESEWRYQQALRAGRFGTWSYDPTTDINYFDARSQTIFGLHRERWTAAEIDRIIHPADFADFQQARALALDPAGDGIFDQTHRIIHPNGAVRWVRANCRVFFDGSGAERRPTRAVGVIADVTEWKQAEERLHQLNTTLEARVQERTEQVRQLVTELSMSEQAERHRISQILHDDLQQRLYSLQFQLMFLRDTLDDIRDDGIDDIRDDGIDDIRDDGIDPTHNDRPVNPSAEAEMIAEPPAVLAPITAMEEELREIIAITRGLSVDLSPPVLEGEGLVEAIGWLAGQMKQKQGMTVQVHGAEWLPVPHTDLRVLLFQAVREALFNVVKHAGVAAAEVRLSHADHELRIEVIDQGRGFDVDAVFAEPGRSHGLWQNQRRLELVGGQMQIESSLGHGTRVILTCPLAKSSTSA